MQGRGNYRLDPASSIQEQKYAASRTLPVLPVSYACSISFSEVMVGALEFLFVKADPGQKNQNVFWTAEPTYQKRSQRSCDKSRGDILVSYTAA